MPMSQLDPGHVIKNVYDSVNEALRVNVVAGAFSVSINSEKVDDSPFTPAVDSTIAIGAFADNVAPDSVDEGDLGALRMSNNRNLFTQIRDAAGNERGVNVTAANALTVDGSAVTQPVSDAGGSLTVDAVDLDIRDLSSAADSVSAVVTSSALPTGAATSVNQTNKSQFTRITDGTDDALVTATGELNVLATAQPGIDIGDVTINNAAGVAAVNVQDGGNILSIDDAGGSLTVDGTVSIISTLDVVDFLDAPFFDATTIAGSGGGFTTSVASLAANVKKVQVFDTSGSFIGVYTGAAASETLKFVFGPGSNEEIDAVIASGTRISFRSLETTAPVAGNITMNFIG